MAAGDLTAWRKQNSDPATVDLVMTDGTKVRAVVMVPRDKILKDVFNVEDTFIEVECLENGVMVYARTAIRSVKPAGLPKADQLERRTKAVEKLGCHAVLELGKTASMDAVSKAYARLSAKYDSSQMTVAGMPPEVLEYLSAMRNKIDTAFAELSAIDALVQQPAA